MPTANHFPPSSPEAVAPGSMFGLLLRLFWFVVGNALLAATGFYILQRRETIFSVADIAYGTVVALLIGSRYVDITKFCGSTGYGEPATLTHWRRYALGVLVVSIVAWLLVHGIAYLRMS